MSSVEAVKLGTQVFKSDPKEKKVEARDIVAMAPPSEASKEMPKTLQEGLKKVSKVTRKNHNRKEKKQKETKNQDVIAHVTPNLDKPIYFVREIEDGTITQMTSVEGSCLLKDNPFSEEEKALLKKMFSRVHLDESLTLMDILGFEIFNCFKAIEDQGYRKQIQGQKEEFLRLYTYFYATIFMLTFRNVSKENKQKNLKTSFFLSFREFTNKLKGYQKTILIMNIMQLSSSEKEGRRKKQDSVYHYLLELYSLFERICTFKDPIEILIGKTLVVHEHSDLVNQGNQEECLDHLIAYLEFFHLASELSKTGIDMNDLFKDAISAVKEMALLTKENKKGELGAKFLQLHNMLNTFAAFTCERSTKYGKDSKDILKGEITHKEYCLQQQAQMVRELNQEEFYAQMVCRTAYLAFMYTLFEDVKRIFEKRIYSVTYPSFSSESDSIKQIGGNASTMLMEETNIRKGELPEIEFDPTLDNEEGDLLKVFEQIRKEQKELYLTTMSLLPSAEISGCLISLSPKLSCSYTKGEELAPLFSLLEPGLKNLPSLLKELDNLRRKHLQQIQEVIAKLNVTKTEDKQRLVDAIKKFYFKESKYICRYVLVLKDAEKLSDFEEYLEKTFKGEETYLPTELMDFVLLDGIEELLSVPIQVETEEVVLTEEVDEKEEVEKEEDDLRPVKTMKKKKTRAPLDAIYPALTKEMPKEVEKTEPFKLPRNLKMRKLVQLLQEEGLFLDKKMRGDHAKYRDPLSKKFVIVPVGKRKGLKAGTSKGVERKVNDISKQ